MVTPEQKRRLIHRCIGVCQMPQWSAEQGRSFADRMPDNKLDEMLHHMTIMVQLREDSARNFQYLVEVIGPDCTDTNVKESSQW